MSSSEDETGVKLIIIIIIIIEALEASIEYEIIIMPIYFCILMYSNDYY